MVDMVIDDTNVTYPCEVDVARIEGKEICGHYGIVYITQSKLNEVGFLVEPNDFELGFVYGSNNGTDNVILVVG